jgi:hypothetical protein
MKKMNECVRRREQRQRCGQRCSALDTIMIPPLMSKVNLFRTAEFAVLRECSVALSICNNLPKCGRSPLSRRKQLVEEYFDSASGEEDWVPHYNIAPTQPVPVIRQNPKEPVRELSLMRCPVGARINHGANDDQECSRPAELSRMQSDLFLEM